MAARIKNEPFLIERTHNMRTSLNPLMYNIPSFSKLFETAGTYEVLFSPGIYAFAMRAGAGAGGTGGAMGNQYQQGDGGAGGIGELVFKTIVITKSVRATVYVGAGGKTAPNGGNGGPGGNATNSGAAGAGGGGGMPTYIQFDPQTLITNYYGWKCPPVDSGVYVGPTRTFYVTYDDVSTIYVSDTPMAYTWGTFALTSNTNYSNGQQVFYASDSATISITISIQNGIVQLVGTTTNMFGATVTPLDISDSFVGNIVLTTSLSPESNAPVYNTDFSTLGNISSVDSDSFVYDGQTYTPYPTADTSTTQTVTTETIASDGGGGGGGGGAPGEAGRFCDGGSGGGGGGYYRLENGKVVSVPGKKGGNGALSYS